MKKKTLIISFIIVVTLILIYFLSLPIIKWNKTYDLSSITSGKEAVEYYFNAINERNPRKVLDIFPSINDSDFKLHIYDYWSLEYCNVQNIKEIESDLLLSEEKMYAVEYDWKFFMNCSPDVYSGLNTCGKTSLYFKTAQNKETGNWYIVDTYTGI